MEFRLIYKGRLPAESSRPRVKDKHHIRKAFHIQLAELWKRHPVLKRQLTDKFRVIYTPDNQVSYPGPGVRQIVKLSLGEQGGATWVEHVANNYKVGNFRFVPLVRKANDFTCAIDILFLRYGHPGEIVTQGGDIDNRLTVLFDSFKKPNTCDEIQAEPAENENPFFCLLEDDSLITSVSITTDRLLIPKIDSERESEVELVVHVKIIDPGAIFGNEGLV